MPHVYTLCILINCFFDTGNILMVSFSEAVYDINFKHSKLSVYVTHLSIAESAEFPLSHFSILYI
jgi:hypothetical protein